MTGQHQHALAAKFFDLIRILDPNSGIGAGEIEFVQMGIFRHRAAEIVPHGANDGFALDNRFFRKCQCEIVARPLGEAGAGKDGAADEAADGGCSIQADQAEEAHESEKQRRFGAVAQFLMQGECWRGHRYNGAKPRSSGCQAIRSSNRSSAGSSSNTARTGRTAMPARSPALRRTRSFSVVINCASPARAFSAAISPSR